MLDQSLMRWRPLHFHDPAPVQGPTRASDAHTFAQTERPSHPSELERPRSCNRPSIQVPISAPDIEPVHGTTMSSTHPSGLRRPSIQARASDLALVHGGSFTGDTSTLSQALDAPDHTEGPPTSPSAPVHGSFLVIQTIYLLFVQRDDNGQWQ